MNLKEYIESKISVKLTESKEDMLGLHGTTHKVDTPKFKGTATLNFQRIIPGKHKTHEYGISYKGKFANGEENSADSKRLKVDHNNGEIYSHKTVDHSSKDLSKVLHKSAPSFVSLDQLK